MRQSFQSAASSMLSELCWGGNASIVQGNGSDDSDLEDSEDEEGADSEETW